MQTALISPSFPTVLLYAASFILVMWTVVDAARLPLATCHLGEKPHGLLVR